MKREMRGFRLLLILVPPSLTLEVQQRPEEFSEGRLGTTRGGQGSIVTGIDSVIGSVHSRLR